MIEPSVFVRRALGQEPERGTGPPARLLRVDPAAFRGDTQPRQAEAGGGDAGHVAVMLVVRRAVRAGAVAHEARVRVRLLPEVNKRAPGQVFEK